MRAGPMLGAAIVGLACNALGGAAQPRTLFAGGEGAAFTTAQVERGRAAYGRACVSCHGAALEGTQFGLALKGAAFEARWRGRTREDFSTHIRTTMPPRGLGLLSGRAYGDIEAFLLMSNGVAPAAGEDGPGAAAPAAVAAQPPDGRVGDLVRPATRGRDDDPLYQAAQAARAAKLARLTPVTAEMLAAPPPGDWLMWRRTFDAHGYSPLARIDRGNVARLRTAWSWSLPDSMNEITPLVHDGVMFIYSGPVVQAMDAATGDLLWQYLRVLPDELDNGRPSRVKTLAIAGDRLFAPFADGHLVALDARTGRVLWDHEVLTDAQRAMNGQPEGVALHLNGGPIVVRDKIIVGVSLGLSQGGGCFIVGLDVATGAEAWRFHTIARPGQPGGDTWNGAPVQERFGGGVWTAGSYDAQLDLVYFGIGNTYNSATLLEPRPGARRVTNNDGAYTNATVALRPATGELAWYFQHHKRDVWDLDWVFEQTLVTLPVDGKPRRVVVTGGKTAVFEGVDAATGRFLFAKDLGVQNVFTHIDPRSGEKTVNPAVQPEAGVAKLLCPSASGARNWPATALNPDTQVLFVPMMETCTDYTYAPRSAEETAKGGADMRFAPRIAPGTDGQFGRVAAIDLNTREILWTHRQRMPVAGAALATAGGLLFNGDVDRSFVAYDQRDGKVLWRTRLNAAPESFPITYEAGGRQYVAVVAGGGSAFGAAGRGLVPEVSSSAAAVTLHVFELPD